MSTASDFAANTCPLCGQPNACAIAAGAPLERCWCRGTTIAAKTVEQIPQDARERYCICARCAATQGDSESER